MKKTIGILFSLLIMSVLLSGCYSKGCDQPVAYKDHAQEPHQH